MKTRTTLLALLSLSLPTTAVMAAPPASPRQRILMDAGWKFYRGEVDGAPMTPGGTPIAHWRWIAEEAGAGDAAKMAAPEMDTSGGNWKDSATGEDTFHGRVGFSWYRTTLPQMAGTVHILHFEGVDDNATVYLNGQQLTKHEGWDDPFDVNLGPAWKDAGPNLLAVLVENTAGAGGITAPVYLQGEVMNTAAGPAAPDFVDRSWRTVHLPHDFIIEGTFSPTADAGHGSLPTTTGWYRKTFDLPTSDRGKALWIDFDGVYRDSRVWLNGRFLGRHASGYTSFRYDIAPYARFGGRNVLAVHVDPRHTEGWWYEGGGIYRHVWLNVANAVHIAPWGTFVTTSMPEPAPGGPAAAAVTVRTTLSHSADFNGNPTFRVISQLINPDGTPGGATDSATTVQPNGQDVTQQLTVAHPDLWSIETPHLYRLHTELLQGGKVIDAIDTSFGIRTIRFDADRGFFLNGKPVKIQGTCNHQDFIGVGIGVPDTLEYWRVKQLKEMGANGWRMSHNPPTPELLDACDRLGMVVMDENRHLGASEGNLAEVANMVQRDRNHPSVIMWSMCNEENGQQGKETGAAIFKAMMDVAKANDPTRPVSSAMNGGWFDPGFATVEDLLGINYGLGNADRFHELHPTMPIFGSETASTTTTRGAYADDKDRVLVTSYHMTDGSWQDIANRPFVAGSFVWTGFDYKGEPTPYGWPSVNSHFGILDMCGFPKDNYYYYQSWWKTRPIVHVMPHWNWAGKEGQDIHVVAFSNCDRVELFLNGQSLGAKDMPRNSHLDWTVKYAPGTLSAKGYDATGKVTATTAVETTGTPASLRLSADRTQLTADAEDLIPVKVEVLDAQGRVVPTADNLVNFTVNGAGVVAGVGNGNPGDHDPDRGRSRHAFNGLCMVLVGATQKRGNLRLTATSSGLTGASMEMGAR